MRTACGMGLGKFSGLCGKAVRQFQAQGISHSHQGNLKVVLKGPVCQSDTQLLGQGWHVECFSTVPEAREMWVEQVEDYTLADSAGLGLLSLKASFSSPQNWMALKGF